VDIDLKRPEFVGGPWHRKVPLGPDEFIVKETGANLLTFWGWTTGNLFLTNKRVIWCPLAAPFARSKIVRLSEVTEVGVRRKSTMFVPGAWFARTGTETHGFESLHDFWGGADPEEWVAAVRSVL
jgi:hypothetical protein